MTIEVKNTDKTRRNELLNSGINILGARNGVVYFSATNDAQEIRYFHCEQSAFDIHFTAATPAELFPALSTEQFHDLKPKSEKFL